MNEPNQHYFIVMPNLKEVVRGVLLRKTDLKVYNNQKLKLDNHHEINILKVPGQGHLLKFSWQVP